ncbi:aquaporin-like protein [Spinellus fusiger]|nr:aquaporin-like protein [Spinellus fusiger]
MNPVLNSSSIPSPIPSKSNDENIQKTILLSNEDFSSIDLESTQNHVQRFVLTKRLRHWRSEHREFLAEFIGTFALVLLIDGVSAEQTLLNAKSWLTSSIGSGLAVLTGICLSGHVSGGHLNPAVTLAFWLFSGFPTHKIATYVIAQISGAFTAAAVLYSVILPAINQFDGGVRQVEGKFATAGIFATYSPHYVGTWTAIGSEILGTAMLLLIIMSSGHPNNIPFCTSQGFVVGLGVMILCLSLGYTSGFSLNPARDLGPRIFTSIAGWGVDVFTVHNYYALIPIFTPFLGAIVGGLVFSVFVDQ